MSARWSDQDLADYASRNPRAVRSNPLSSPLIREGVKIEFVDEPKQSKYRNEKTLLDGIVFDSKREAAAYQDLKLRERAGEISGLTLQPKYELVVNGIKIGSYVGDFAFIENGKTVVSDAKGVRTPVYRLKKKLMRAIYGIEIREV